jgi:hypothetical protein
MKKLLVGAVLLASVIDANAQEPRTAEDIINGCVAEVRSQRVSGASEFDIILQPGGQIGTYGNDHTKFLFVKCLSRYGIYYRPH